MIDEMKAYIDRKRSVLEDYFTVPEDLQAEMDDFVQDLMALGEACTSVAEFENRFESEGFSERYNSFFPRCVPKKRKMSKREMHNSLLKSGEILNENKKELLEQAKEDVINGVLNDAKDEMYVKKREKMIEEGTFADYTIWSNRIQDAGRLVGALGRKFRKKK